MFDHSSGQRHFGQLTRWSRQSSSVFSRCQTLLAGSRRPCWPEFQVTPCRQLKKVDLNNTQISIQQVVKHCWQSLSCMMCIRLFYIALGLRCCSKKAQETVRETTRNRSKNHKKSSEKPQVIVRSAKRAQFVLGCADRCADRHPFGRSYSDPKTVHLEAPWFAARPPPAGPR